MATRNHKRKKAVNGLAGAHHGGSLEEAIPRLAHSGELAKSSQRAVKRQRRKGIPITFSRGLEIVEEQSDGTTHVLGRIKPARFTRPAGVGIIED